MRRLTRAMRRNDLHLDIQGMLGKKEWGGESRRRGPRSEQFLGGQKRSERKDKE